jgi:hypothetical protein
LETLTEEQLDSDISIAVVPSFRCANPETMSDCETYGEFFEMENFGISSDSFVLDDGHPYLVTVA